MNSQENEANDNEKEMDDDPADSIPELQGVKLKEWKKYDKKNKFQNVPTPEVIEFLIEAKEELFHEDIPDGPKLGNLQFHIG